MKFPTQHTCAKESRGFVHFQSLQALDNDCYPEVAPPKHSCTKREHISKGFYLESTESIWIRHWSSYWLYMYYLWFCSTQPIFPNFLYSSCCSICNFLPSTTYCLQSSLSVFFSHGSHERNVGNARDDCNLEVITQQTIYLFLPWVTCFFKKKKKTLSETKLYPGLWT